MSYEIRVYNKRYEMNPDYYHGKKGVRRKWKADTVEELLRKWRTHLIDYEGETYSVWDGENIITGGAYDPSDYEYIYEYFGANKNKGI